MLRIVSYHTAVVPPSRYKVARSFVLDCSQEVASEMAPFTQFAKLPEVENTISESQVMLPKLSVRIWDTEPISSQTNLFPPPVSTSRRKSTQVW